MLQRVFYGFIAVFALAALGLGLAVAGSPGLAFGLFAALTIGGALVCVWERSVVRSAFALMATFTGVACFFVLLESEFLAMAQILIYVGAILVLILFGVMLTPPDLNERKLSRVLPGIAIIGACTAWIGMKTAETATWAIAAAPPTGGKVEGFSTAERIGVGFLAADEYVIPFELAAVVLTVALVGAVYIARRRRVDLEAPTERGEV